MTDDGTGAKPPDGAANPGTDEGARLADAKESENPIIVMSDRYRYMRTRMYALCHPHTRQANSLLCTLSWRSFFDQKHTQFDVTQFGLAVTHSLRKLFGEVGAAMPVDIVVYDEQEQEGILRVRSRCV